MINKKKIKDWFSKPENITLCVVLLFGLAIRIYYFFLTKGQPLWWDEAEYLSIAKHWVVGLPFDIFIVRPIMLPFFVAILFKVGFGEVAVRVMELLFSCAGIVFLYLLGKELYNKMTGIVAALLISSFYLHLFFTSRILTGVPTVTLWIMAVYFFWKGYVQKGSPYYTYAAALVIAIGTLMRYPYGMIVLPLLIYVILTKKFTFLKDKTLWKAGVVFIIPFIPYVIWSMKTFGEISIFAAKGFYENNVLFLDYIKLLPTYLYSPIPFFHSLSPSFLHVLLMLFLASIALFLFRIVIGIDLIFKEKNIQKSILVLLLFLIPFLYFSFMHDHVEPRFMFYIFPAVFLMISVVTMELYGLIKKYNHVFAASLIVVVLMVGVTEQVSQGDNIIRGKITSYQALKDAGEWLKENSNEEDIVLSAGIPQNAHYSERETRGVPSKEEDFEELVRTSKVRYLLISTLEKSPDWSYDYGQRNVEKVIPVFGIFADTGQTQPVVLIFELKKDKF